MTIEKRTLIRGQNLPFGRHRGLLIEKVILKYPDWIAWLSRQPQGPGFRWLYEYIDACIEIFDSKPFIDVACSGRRNDAPCDRRPTRFSLRPGSEAPRYWCEDCDPALLGGGALAVTTSYMALLLHIRGIANAKRELYRSSVIHLAATKGYTGRLTNQKIVKFFYGPNATPAK